MKLLKNLLYGVRLVDVQGSTNLAVESVTSDSRKVAPGTLFVALPGSQSDGRAFIPQALAKGEGMLFPDVSEVIRAYDNKEVELATRITVRIVEFPKNLEGGFAHASSVRVTADRVQR